VKTLHFEFRVFWLRGTEMFLVCAIDELQRLRCFDSGDAHSDVL